jgi:hypothetical protein
MRLIEQRNNRVKSDNTTEKYSRDVTLKFNKIIFSVNISNVAIRFIYDKESFNKVCCEMRNN